MRKILYIIALSLLFVPFTACKDKGPDKVDLGYLEIISTEGTRFSYNGGEATIVVNTSSPVEAILDNEQWCHLDDTKPTGNIIWLRADKYSGLESRTTFLTVRADGRERVIPLTQTTFTMSVPETVNIAWRAGDYSIKVFPADFEKTVTSNATWLVPYVNDYGDVVLTATANTAASRSAVVTITAGEQTKSVAVTQLSSLTVDLTVLEFSSAAGSKVVTYTYESGTDGGAVTATSDQAWATTTIDATAKTITVAVLANDQLTPRTATISVSGGGGLDAKITVSQAARKMNETDIYGVYDVEYVSLFDVQDGVDKNGDGYIDTRTSTGVTIRKKEGAENPNTIVITNLFATAAGDGVNFEAILDLDGRRINIAANTPVLGGSVQAGTMVTRTDGGDIYLSIMGTKGLESSGISWGYSISGYYDIIYASGWTRTAP